MLTLPLRRWRRGALAGSLWATSLLATPLASSPVHAAFTACRSDPIVVLSNGIVLDLSVTMSDAVTDVENITYLLRAPAGVQVLRVLSTDGVVGYRERFVFRHDSQISGTAGVYVVGVRVKTGTPDVALTATIAGGEADALGITPAMVSRPLTRFRPVDGNDAARHRPRGPRAPTVLPPRVTAALDRWAQSAAWTVTASTQGTSGQQVVASITL